MASPRVVKRSVPSEGEDNASLIAGLFATPARIAPKYFYDAMGCALYAAICQLDEYYPTRTERAIFAEHRLEIARAVGRGVQFVDLGAGDCCKALSWLPHVQPSRYLAVDFAEHEIRRALERMAPEFPEIEMVGVVADFAHAFDLEADLTGAPALFFYPGSSIGNFAPEAARGFLAGVARHCASRPGSGLLIGVDTKKGRARLEAAYDDALGVTAAFNRNVLSHVNRLLDADFEPRGFAHVALYDEGEGRIEMHLEAIADCRVRIAGRAREFRRGERIHTEDSYKYAPAEFEALLGRAGFGAVHRWQDAAGDFAVFLARTSPD